MLGVIYLSGRKNDVIQSMAILMLMKSKTILKGYEGWQYYDKNAILEAIEFAYEEVRKQIGLTKIT